MRPLAPLLSVGGTACHSSPVATDTATAPPPAAKPTADSAALRKAAPAAATGQAVPFVGKPGLKAALRSGGLAPTAASTRCVLLPALSYSFTHSAPASRGSRGAVGTS